MKTILLSLSLIIVMVANGQDWKDYWNEILLQQENSKGRAHYDLRSSVQVSERKTIYYWRIRLSGYDSLTLESSMQAMGLTADQKHFLFDRSGRCPQCNRFPCIWYLDYVSKNLFIVNKEEFDELQKSGRLSKAPLPNPVFRRGGNYPKAYASVSLQPIFYLQIKQQ